MKITAFHYHELSGMLRIDSDGGARGACPLSAAHAASAIALAQSAGLTGADPFLRERLWQGMQATQAPDEALAGLDIALWDLAGNALGLPVYRVIGGFRADMPALWLGAPSADAQAIVAQVRKAVQLGYVAFCDRFTGPAAQMPAVAAALREATGSHTYLTHDSQRRYTHIEALAVGRALEAQDYHWFKSPLAAGDADGLRRLAAALDLPILDGVTGPSAQRGMSQLAATQAADQLAIQVWQCGGITGALKLARLAEAFGLHCEFQPSTMNGDELVRAQLMAAVRNAQFFAIDHDLNVGRLHPAVRFDDGRIHVPKAPGMGWDHVFSPSTAGAAT
jgi:L-alanine-DL-glutamate epimerase-like enolase superfamily enzyme